VAWQATSACLPLRRAIITVHHHHHRNVSMKKNGGVPTNLKRRFFSSCRDVVAFSR
jgi:hypothetical protein